MSWRVAHMSRLTFEAWVWKKYRRYEVKYGPRKDRGRLAVVAVVRPLGGSYIVLGADGFLLSGFTTLAAAQEFADSILKD